MPDNWGYVVAAYAVAVMLIGGYWRFLTRRGRELDVDRRRRRPPPGPARSHPRSTASP